MSKTTGYVLKERAYTGEVTPPDAFEDESRFGNDGVHTNITWVRNPQGIWIKSFNGSSSRIVFPTNPALKFTGDFAISCWVKWSGDSTPKYQTFIASVAGFTSNACFLRVWGATALPEVLRSRVGIGNPTHDAGNSVYSANDLTTAWTLVDASRLNGIIKLYLNAILEATGGADTSIYDFGQGGTGIGNSAWDGADGYYSGDVAPVKLWHRARSVEEIEAIFQSERHWFGV